MEAFTQIPASQEAELTPPQPKTLKPVALHRIRRGSEAFRETNSREKSHGGNGYTRDISPWLNAGILNPDFLLQTSIVCSQHSHSFSAAEQGQSPCPRAGEDKPPPTPNCLLLLHMRASETLHAWDTLGWRCPLTVLGSLSPLLLLPPGLWGTSSFPAPVGIAAHLSDIRTLQIPGVF